MSMNISAATAVSKRIEPQQVSRKVLNAAQNDGDGRTGAAALNDGDAAAQTAARSVHQVDIKA